MHTLLEKAYRRIRTATAGTVQAWLAAGLDVNARPNWTAHSLLHSVFYDCRNPDPDVVATLLDAGANVNAGLLRARGPARGPTPLHFAAEWSNPDVILMLLEAGADMYATGFDGALPLHIASAWNLNPEVIRTLLDVRGSNVNAKREDGKTPLHMAAKRNCNPDVARILLEAGADVHARDCWGFLPLDCAALDNENPNVVRILLDGRESNVVAGAGDDGIGRTLGLAVVRPHLGICRDADPRQRINIKAADLEVIGMLLDAGADLNGASLLHGAAQKNNTHVLRALLDAGADVNARDTFGSTPLHVAAEVRASHAVLVLLDAGASAAVRDGRGNTPSDLWPAIAIANGLLPKGYTAARGDDMAEAAKQLAVAAAELASALEGIEARAREDKAAADVNGASLLHEAAEKNKTHVLRALLDAGADVNARDTFGSTPLHVAAEVRASHAVLVLLDAGASAAVRDGKGNTPSDLWPAIAIANGLLPKGYTAARGDDMAEAAKQLAVAAPKLASALEGIEAKARADRAAASMAKNAWANQVAAAKAKKAKGTGK